MNARTPDLFTRGPSPLVRLVFYCTLAIACIVVDSRYHGLNALRSGVSLVIYPFQEVARLPTWISARIADTFSTERSLREENARLRERLLLQADQVQKYPTLLADLNNLKALDSLPASPNGHHRVVEILAMAHNPYIQKVLIGKGRQSGVEAGSPVISPEGVVGQVTTVYPFYSEVSLITDKNMVLPVMVSRNGLRTIAYGAGSSGTMTLPYVPIASDVQEGDALVTSGLDGIYPAGLAVGNVAHVKRDANAIYAQVTIIPTSAVNSHRYLMVLDPRQAPAADSAVLDRPQTEPALLGHGPKKTRKP